MPKKLWKKGQSGNPSGRPKKVFDIRAEWDWQLAEVDPKDPQGRKNYQIGIAALVRNMKLGSIKAWNEYLDRTFGKPAQAVAIADMRTMSRDEEIQDILESLKVLRQLEEPESGDGEPIIQ